MAKTILILTDAFGAPLFGPRIRSLVHYLQQYDYRCIVMTEQLADSSFCIDQCEYHGMPYYTGHNDTFRWLADKVFSYREKRFYRFVLEQVDMTNIDVILASSFNDFPLLTASKLAKRYHKPLLVDLRDIIEEWGDANYLSGKYQVSKGIKRLYERRAIRQRNRVLRQADHVTTISPWHREFLSHINRNTTLIYNGYEPREFFPVDVTSTSFDISYLGRFYGSALRNPEMLFKAAETLVDECPEMRLCFYCEKNSEAEILQLAKKYHITNKIVWSSYIPRDKALQRMHESSILVVLSVPESENGPHGIMTSKFFEIVGIEKPALIVESDRSCLANAVKQVNAGLAAETADEIVSFLRYHYQEWKQRGFTRQPVVNKEIFSRHKQAIQFKTLIDTLIQQ